MTEVSAGRRNRNSIEEHMRVQRKLKEARSLLLAGDDQPALAATLDCIEVLLDFMSAQYRENHEAFAAYGHTHRASVTIHGKEGGVDRST